jgi:hypothetical protein
MLGGAAARLQWLGRAVLQPRFARSVCDWKAVAKSLPHKATLINVDLLPPCSTVELQDALRVWEETSLTAGTRCLWLETPMARGDVFSLAAKQGFTFHHAEGDRASLIKWLEKGPCLVPAFATHQVRPVVCMCCVVLCSCVRLSLSR